MATPRRDYGHRPVAQPPKKLPALFHPGALGEKTIGRLEEAWNPHVCPHSGVFTSYHRLHETYRPKAYYSEYDPRGLEPLPDGKPPFHVPVLHHNKFLDRPYDGKRAVDPFTGRKDHDFRGLDPEIPALLVPVIAHDAVKVSDFERKPKNIRRASFYDPRDGKIHLEPLPEPSTARSRNPSFLGAPGAGSPQSAHRANSNILEIPGIEIPHLGDADEPKKKPKKPAPPPPKSALRIEVPPKDKCMELFNRLDPNGNGMLSLAELDKGVVELWPKLNNKPAIMRAYKAADVSGEGFVTRKEFMFFLKFLTYYNNLWNDFDAMDTGDDRRVTKEEFVKFAPKLKVSDPETAFAEMDTNGGGFVLFDEFCTWMAKNRGE